MPTITSDIALFAAYTFALIFGGFEIRGWKDNAAIESAKEKQAISVLFTEHKNQATTNEVDHAYQSKVSAIDSGYDVFIRSLYPVTGSPLPSVTKGSPCANGTASNHGFSQADKEALAHLAKDADLQTNRLIYLQEWVKEQGME